MSNTLRFANAIFAQLCAGTKGARKATNRADSIRFANEAGNLIRDLLAGDYVHPTLRGDYKAHARIRLGLARMARMDAGKMY